MRWIAHLARCRPVLVATDNDDDPRKGDAAARYWLHALAPAARRWRPFLKDVAAMAEAGLDIRYWVEAGLHSTQTGGA